MDGRHDQFGKWSRGRFFTYAQGFMLNAACTAASPANNYTWNVLRIYTCIIKTKVPISNSNTWNNNKIYKTLIQFSIIFSAVAFYYECCKSGRKKEERKGVGWEATLNQGESSHSLTLVMYGWWQTNLKKTENTAPLNR